MLDREIVCRDDQLTLAWADFGEHKRHHRSRETIIHSALKVDLGWSPKNSGFANSVWQVPTGRWYKHTNLALDCLASTLFTKFPRFADIRTTFSGPSIVREESRD